ncbi:MAG: hypothetical protein HY778_12400 [Betaproteobacteria bacterium]|nr:hypothetical protein [Betaproteobacteria bacterium]
MGAFEAWFAANGLAVAVVGGVCLLAALMLLLAAAILKRAGRRITVSASRGGVVIVGDHRGIINTGSLGGGAPAGTPDRLTRAAGWATVLGIPLAVLGLILTLLAWRFPVQP